MSGDTLAPTLAPGEYRAAVDRLASRHHRGGLTPAGARARARMLSRRAGVR